MFHELAFAAVVLFSTEKAADQLSTRCTTLIRVPMTKDNISLGDRVPCVPLGDLLAAMGKADANNYETWLLEMALEEIKSAWLARGRMRSIGSDRKLLRRFRANTAKRLELRRQLEPLREDILLVGFKQANPGADERVLREGLEQIEYRQEVSEALEDRDIADLIDSMSDFRKRQARRLVVEPFLLLLEEYGVVPHPKRLPLSRMMHAFFDWLGIEQVLRPTDAGIRTIARDLRKRDKRD